VNNFLIDFHVVYAGLVVYLMMKRAGHVFGLDGWAANLHVAKQRPAALGGRFRRED
jgi:thiosulfate dehydrogenase (quinone) large subunit